MPYKTVNRGILPPSLKRNKSFDYQQLNTMIIKAFDNTVLKKVESGTNYHYQSTKIYLETPSVKEIKSVQITNRQGSEITYKENLQTGTYQNYVELNRPLLTGEAVTISFIGTPHNTDMLKSDLDNIYLREEVYKTLIKDLYEFAKLGNIENNKETKKQDGKD